MPRTIWKTVLQVADAQDVPLGAEILCAREQHDEICIWYRCDPTAPKAARRITICGTGHPAPSEQDSTYLGSASLRGGQLIFHVFEKLR